MSSMSPRCLSPWLFLFDSTIGYTRSLLGGAHARPKLLRDCLEQIHKDVITCWNFKGEVLNYHRYRLFVLDLHPRR